MSHTKGKCEVVHTNWRTSILVFGGRIMGECNVDPDFDEDNASDVEAEDAEMEKAANARRLAALWNAAEELGLTTEEIEGIASDTNSEATVECFLGRPATNNLMKKYMRKQYGRTR